MDFKTLKHLCDNLKNIKIAVAGDFFLDRYYVIDPALNEKSLETGLTAYQVVGRRLYAGAAGTVTNNLKALGVGTVYAVGIIGGDGEGVELKKALELTGVMTDCLIESNERVTPTYTKPMIKKSEKEEEINRFDIKNLNRTPEKLEKAIAKILYEIAEKVDAIVVLDQVCEEGCGVITPDIRGVLADIADKKPDLVIYADSRSYSGKFRNVIVKCNEHELIKAVSKIGNDKIGKDDIKSCGYAMRRMTHKPVFVTRGDKGIQIFDEENSYEVPAFKIDGPVDICGAGDAATSGIVSALCSDLDLIDAALLGNIVSSITIQQLGTTGTASCRQVLERYNEYMKKYPGGISR